MLIGSTGVYPRSTGGVWSENRPVSVETPRQEVLLLTERVLIVSGLPYVILRCGGLYGEGRDALLWIGRRKELPSTELTDEVHGGRHRLQDLGDDADAEADAPI